MKNLQPPSWPFIVCDTFVILQHIVNSPGSDLCTYKHHNEKELLLPPVAVSDWLPGSSLVAGEMPVLMKTEYSFKSQNCFWSRGHYEQLQCPWWPNTFTPKSVLGTLIGKPLDSYWGFWGLIFLVRRVLRWLELSLCKEIWRPGDPLLVTGSPARLLPFAASAAPSWAGSCR